MATNPQLSYAAVNAEANALAALCNSGKLRIYSGTVPIRADDSIGAAVLLAELTLNATAWQTAVNGVLTANAITGANAGTTGAPSFFRAFNSAGTTAFIQGTAGNTGCDLNLGVDTLQAGGMVNITGLTHTVPRGA